MEGTDRSATPVVEAHGGNGEDWDRALAGFDGSSFCHCFGWRYVMEEALGHQTYWWVARDRGGSIRGLLPLVRVRSRLFGDYLVSMPFLNYGGPVGDEAAREALALHAVAYAEELGVGLLELRNRSPMAATSRLTLNQRKLTVVKSLPETTEQLWEDGIRSKVRNKIRLPMKNGMKVRFGPGLLDPFYRVFAEKMRDLGTPVLPRSFFDVIQESFQGSSFFAVVEMDGEPVAAGLALAWGGEVELTWSGSSRRHARLAPNMLLHWALMEKAVRQGMHTFNFGRCSFDSNTHRFKRQWGTDDEPLPWLQWSPSRVVSTPSPDSPKFRLATSLWSRLPLVAANRIGPRLSRIIP